MVEPSRIMPNIYYLGFKMGEGMQYLWTDWSDVGSTMCTSSLLYSKLDGVVQTILDFPAVYGHWWWNLVRKDPIHVLVETTLVLSILYILMARSKDWKETEEHLDEKEQEELLREWKLYGRAPLTPSSSAASTTTHITTTTADRIPALTPNTSSSSTSSSESLDIVVHKVHGPYLDVSVNTPGGGTLTAASSNSNNNNNQKNKKSSSNSSSNNNSKSALTNSTSSADNPTIMTVLNFATFDYLGMSSNQPTVRQAADAALTKYGCGSCGPRGFYGTIDVHLQLERDFASFLKVDGAILYSDGASTCASTIAAFAKRGDLLVCDEGIYEPLRTGVALSRAHVQWFKHNDMADLRNVLTKIQAHDIKVKRPMNAQRRFLVVEGLYKTTGTICPLKELVALKHEFCYRLILDESQSFGTLGKTGRGVHEFFGCRLMHDIEITTISLEHSMGAVGGITVGTEEVVEHQRLSGSGYCYSASSPPFTATAAMEALKLLDNSPQTTLQPLQDNVAYLHHKLTQLCHIQLEDVLLVTSAPESPILFLQVADIPETRDLEELLFLQEVVQACLRLSSTTTTASSSSSLSNSTNNNNNNKKLSSLLPANTTTTTTSIMGMALVVVNSPPGIRINVSATHTHEHLDTCLRILTESVEIVMSSRAH